MLTLIAKQRWIRELILFLGTAELSVSTLSISAVIRSNLSSEKSVYEPEKRQYTLFYLFLFIMFFNIVAYFVKLA